MKKVFGFFIGFALVMAATLFTSCTPSYKGKYYDVTYIPEVTEEEYGLYDENGIEEFNKLSREKPGVEKKTNLTESELIDYIRGKNADEKFIQEILEEVKKSKGYMIPYDYLIGEARYFDFYYVIAIN